MVFEFTPDETALQESFWRFRIPSLQVRAHPNPSPNPNPNANPNPNSNPNPNRGPRRTPKLIILEP